MLAIRRGEAEGFLKVNLEIEEEKVLEGIEKIVVKGNNECTYQVRMAVMDTCKTVVFPFV